MDTSRLGVGELIAGSGAVALLILMFLPWYGVDVNLAGFSASETANAWQTLSFIDILLFLLALTTIIVVAADMAGGVAEDFASGTLLAACGGLALLLVLYRLIDLPTPDAPAGAENAVDFGRRIGIFLALVAAAAMTYGGWRAMSERTAGPGAGTDGSDPPVATA